MNIDRVLGHIVKTMLAREQEGKKFGVIVLAEGLAELLPALVSGGDPPRRARPHFDRRSQSGADVRQVWWPRRINAATGRKRKVTGLQLGYESRCAKPHAFDVMLGSQLGVGAYRALVEEGLERRDGLRLRPAGPALRRLRSAGRSRDAGDDRPLHRTRQRLPPPGALPGDARQRMRCSGRFRAGLVRASPWCWGRPVTRGSGSTASSQARAVALKIASLMWWLLRPWCSTMCRLHRRVGGDRLPEILAPVRCRSRRSWAWESRPGRPDSSGRSGRPPTVTSVSSIGSVKWP